MIYFIAFTLGISGFFHPCFIGTITTFYAALVLVRDRKKFILGSILGIIIINFLFLFFTDLLSHIFHQRIFNYIIGGMFILFGLMFLGVIKHKHSHLLLSVDRIKNANPVLVGIFIVFSWIQSFAIYPHGSFNLQDKLLLRFFYNLTLYNRFDYTGYSI